MATRPESATRRGVEDVLIYPTSGLTEPATSLREPLQRAGSREHRHPIEDPLIPSEFSLAAERVSNGADPRAEARLLILDMTVDELLGCLDGDTPFWPGTLDIGGGGYYEHTWPAAQVERLGIPGIEFADGPRGCVIGASTAFPVPMARGASFDPELERRVGLAIGAELRARGATYTGAVCVNLLRHPAWGRAQETYGEDPHHVGEMGAALTEGLQQHVLACMKHFALNSMENSRFKVDVTADERALHEVYLPHFKRIQQAGVASVMSAYNAVNGEWCGDSPTLLNDILRKEWGFEGFVITDFAFGLRDPVNSVAAGCNIEMPFRQQRAITLGDALDAKELLLEDVKERVEEFLATLLRHAEVFSNQPRADVIACKEHRDLAREAASSSMVLLQNQDALLPLEPSSVRKLAVLGRLADTPNLGDGGSSDVRQPEVVTPLAGLRAALPGAEVAYSETDVTIARDAGIAVVVVGYTKDDEGEYVDQSGMLPLAHLFPPIDHPETGFPPNSKPEAPAEAPGDKKERGLAPGGDRKSLRLNATDEALIEAAVATGTPVVVAVMAGSAVVMPWLDTTAATLMIWYPGMQGGHALADVLLGQDEPGGRLPFAIPRDEQDLVDFDRDATAAVYGLLHGQWWLDSKTLEAHRPFGFGLSYTSFAFQDATVVDGAVSLSVRNTGRRSGSTVLQVYASVPASEFERPRKRLVGFAKVTLDAESSLELQIPIDEDALQIRRHGEWLREPVPVVYSLGFCAETAEEIATSD